MFGQPELICNFNTECMYFFLPNNLTVNAPIHQYDDPQYGFYSCPGEICPACKLNKTIQRWQLHPVFNFARNKIDILRLAAPPVKPDEEKIEETVERRPRPPTVKAMDARSSQDMGPGPVGVQLEQLLLSPNPLRRVLKIVKAGNRFIVTPVPVKKVDANHTLIDFFIAEVEIGNYDILDSVYPKASEGEIFEFNPSIRREFQMRGWAIPGDCLDTDDNTASSVEGEDDYVET